MKTTTGTNRQRSRRSYRRLATGAVTILATFSGLVASAAPTNARPMLDPCQYDHTCITTTVRR